MKPSITAVDLQDSAVDPSGMVVEARSLPEPSLRDLWRALRAAMPTIRPAWIMLGLSLVMALVMAGILGEMLLRDGLSVVPLVLAIWGPLFLVATVVGVLILSRWPRHRLGWVLCLAGTTWLVAQGLYALGMRGLTTGEVNPWSVVAQAGGFYPFGLYLLCVEVPLIFPTGKLAAPGWRYVRWLGLAGALGATLETMFGSPLVMHGEFGPLPNPWFIGHPGWRAEFFEWAGMGFFLMLWMGVPAGISMVWRLLRAEGIERLQLKWIAWDTAIVVVAYVLHYTSATQGWYAEAWGWMPNVAWGLALNSIAIVTGIAILRFHLFDIHLVISRTLVYTLLTAVIIGGYVALVVLFGAIVDAVIDGPRSQLLVSALATTAIALAVQPLRDRLQVIANRLIYGERDRPDTLLMRLGEQLEASVSPEIVLRDMTRLVSETLRLPHVAVAVGNVPRQQVVAVTGVPGPVQVSFPMVCQGELVGQLRVSPRTSADGFSREDRRVLSHIAGQAAVAAYANRLTLELRGAREQLVSTREEERRRLRRDLHDGLGAQLAALLLHVNMTRKLIPTDPETAVSMLVELQSELRTAIMDIRHLVHGLRPPALDEFGLVLALRSRLAALRGEGIHALACELDAPSAFPDLPAAMEVAIFRIVEEAMTNVVRHSHARSVIVTIGIEDGVQVSIEDDGVGMKAGYEAGVGMHSMRERAEELGGRLQVGASERGGTRVSAWFPPLIVGDRR